MKKITFKVYKEAILRQYLVAQKSDASGILSIPTPAQLRDFCMLKCDKGFNRADEEVMRAFFETKNDETLKRSIEHCNIDKFRPVISFFRGEKDTENQTRVGLAAILVDFSPRPYSVFLNDGKENDLLSSGPDNKKDTENHRGEVTKGKTSYKWTYIALGVIGLVIFGYAAKCFVWPEKQCMQWQGDHYELVSCQGGIDSVYINMPIEPINKKAIDLKKIEVCDTFPFFKGDEANVWYCKVNGEPEYFDGPGAGFHPVTKRQLNPITNHIIDKYVRAK